MTVMNSIRVTLRDARLIVVGSSCELDALSRFHTGDSAEEGRKGRQREEEGGELDAPRDDVLNTSAHANRSQWLCNRLFAGIM